MPSRPKVPFELHAAVRLVSNTEIVHGVEVALLPDGALGVLRGDWNTRQIELHPTGGGPVETLLAPDPTRPVAHFVWSDDGRRWAGVGGRFEGDNRPGEVIVGERGRAEPLCVARIAEYGAVTRNALRRPATTLVFSPDGTRMVVRVSPRDRRDHLVDVDVSTGESAERRIEGMTTYLFAHAFDPDGTLFAVTADAGPQGGLWWFAPGVRDHAEQAPSPVGFVLLPAPRGLWVVGAPGHAFRIGKGVAARTSTDAAARIERAERLRSRATVKWDQTYLDHVVANARADADTETHSETLGETTGTRAQLRSFEHELFWETSTAARIGDDDVLISDGIAVFLWREHAAGIARLCLLEDLARCTYRAARILGLAAQGDTFVVLWQKDISGAKTVASRFVLDRAALNA